MGVLRNIASALPVVLAIGATLSASPAVADDVEFWTLETLDTTPIEQQFPPYTTATTSSSGFNPSGSAPPTLTATAAGGRSSNQGPPSAGSTASIAKAYRVWAVTDRPQFQALADLTMDNTMTISRSGSAAASGVYSYIFPDSQYTLASTSSGAFQVHSYNQVGARYTGFGNLIPFDMQGYQPSSFCSWSPTIGSCGYGQFTGIGSYSATSTTKLIMSFKTGPGSSPY